jgi:catechol 2,3-dioxygenase-like lactoylglutathione lyase family enzyme
MRDAIAAGLPDGFGLPIHAVTPHHGTGVCIWEGPSVDAVRELVESVVGPFSQNEYLELEVDGLPPAGPESLAPSIGADHPCRWRAAVGHDEVMEEAIPIVRVADAEASVAWYTRLGYEKEWEHRFEPSLPAFVSIARHGTSRLFLSEHSRDAGGPLVAGTVVYIRVGDVDAIAKQFDAEIVEMPWAREVFLTDPDGNRLRIGTPSA